MSYTITRKALADINEIWVYTASNWSIEQADRYYNLIFDEIEYIVKNFDMARDFGHVRSGYRVTTVKSHLVFLRRKKDNSVEVVRVLHKNMDIENRLNG